MSDSVSRVKRGIPLSVIFTKSHHHNVRFFQQHFVASLVKPSAFVIIPELSVFRAGDLTTNIITELMVGNWATKGNIQTQSIA